MVKAGQAGGTSAKGGGSTALERGLAGQQRNPGKSYCVAVPSQSNGISGALQRHDGERARDRGLGGKILLICERAGLDAIGASVAMPIQAAKPASKIAVDRNGYDARRGSCRRRELARGPDTGRAMSHASTR